MGADVDALFSGKWWRGKVAEVVHDRELVLYEVLWPINGDFNRIAHANVRAHKSGTPDG